jgi:hypothetical protein
MSALRASEGGAPLESSDTFSSNTKEWFPYIEMLRKMCIISYLNKIYLKEMKFIEKKQRLVYEFRIFTSFGVTSQVVPNLATLAKTDFSHKRNVKVGRVVPDSLL